MNKMLSTSALILALIPIALSSDVAFKWEDCGENNADKSLTFKHISIDPQPMTISMRTDLNVSATAILRDTISNDFKFQVKVRRMTGGWNIPIFSLTQSVCTWLTGRIFSPLICPIYKQATGLSECKCPVEAGEYKAVDATINVDLSKLPVPRIFYRLGAGNYEFEFTAWNSRGKKAGCAKVQSPLKMNM